MNFVDNILRRIGYIKAAELQADHGRYPMAYAADKRWHMPDPEIFANQADLYRTLSWVNSAISIKAQAGAAVRFSVKRMRGEDTTDINNHEFELRLSNPNPSQSRAEFLEALFSYYSLTGNAYIWLNRADERAPIDELWVVQPNEIAPVPDGNLFIKGYEYTPPSSAAMLLPTWQIVHVKRFNPHNQFIGLSPIESVARQAYGDLGKTERESKLFNEQNGNPPGILAFADNYGDEEWENLQHEVEERARKMRRFLMIRNTKAGGVNWLQTAMSNVDQQYLQSRTFTKEEIYNVFAPGLASMLAVNATEANSKSGKATFSEYALWPMLDAFAQKLTTCVLPAYGLKLVGMFDDPRVKERALELQEMGEYAKTHTVEEVRRKYYQDDPLGDERDNLLPAQITADSGAKKPEPPPEPVVQPVQIPAENPQEMMRNNPDDVQNTENQMQSEPDDDEMMLEAKRWKRVARKALKAGKSADVDFVTEIIPAERQAIIHGKLRTAKTNDEIDMAFEVEKPLDPILMLAQEMRECRKALKYSDDQPRDDHGMWTSGGGGGGGSQLGGNGSTSGGGGGVPSQTRGGSTASTQQAIEIIQMQAYGAPPKHVEQYLKENGIDFVEAYHATSIDGAHQIEKNGVRVSHQEGRPDASYFFLDKNDVARNADNLGLGHGGTEYAIVTARIPRAEAANIRDDGLYNGTFTSSYSAARLLKPIPAEWVQKIEIQK